MSSRPPLPPPDLFAYRALCLGACVLISVIGLLYHALDPTVVDPMEVRWGIAALPGLLFLFSFVGGRKRGDVAFLTSLLIYVFLAWTVGLLALNRLDPAYVTGYLFVLMAAGVASVGFNEMRATAQCLGFGVVSAVVVAYIVPAPEMNPWLFSAFAVASGVILVIGAALQMRTRSGLVSSESRYRAVFENTADGILLIEVSSLRILQANRAYLTLTGYSAEELRAMTLYDLIAARPDDIDRVIRQVRTEHHADLGEQHHRCKDGSFIELDIDLALFTHSGRPMLCFTAHDLTEQKRIRAEAEEARDHAEEMLRLKSGFLNNMSHELRTPLVSILGFAEFLTEELSDEQQEIAETIERSARRLHDTLNSVLDLAQLEGGEVNLQPDVVDVSVEARETLVLLHPLAAQKGLSLRFLPSDSVRILADPGAFQRVLTNLVSNAIKFTDKGDVGIEIVADSHRVFVRVHDTGTGISEEFIPHLFDEFKQESMGMDRQHEGNGLGLTITKRLVELMGGRIVVESTVGKGSTFTVAFARTWATMPLDNQRAEAVARTTPAALSTRPRVLVVEDNADTRRLVERTLQDYYDVDAVADAATCLEMAERAWYDVIVVDIQLNGGPGGLDVLRQLRAMSAYTYAPILAVTAYAMPGDKERFLSAGFDGYLAKPFTRDQLFWSLEDVIDARTASQPSE